MLYISSTTKLNPQKNNNYQNTHDTFHRARTNYPKIFMDIKTKERKIY